MDSSPGSCVLIGGVPVDRRSRSALVEQMRADCQAQRCGQSGAKLVFDCNGQGISLAASDAEYSGSLKKADIIHADGQFVVWVSRLVGLPIAERSATTDLIHDCAADAAKNGLSFFLLGGAESENAEAARRLAMMYPGLSIAGRRHGFFSADQERAVIDEVNASNADILWVGLGKPKEQRFCAQWRDRLNVGWVVTCGGCFNYITGSYSRAPTLLQRIGMEWLYRALTSPRTLLWRYATTTPHALWLAMTKSGKVSN